METDPSKINDADRQIQGKVYEEAQKYAETRTKSRALNKERAASRAKIDEMGIRTDAYQTGIRLIKDLSVGERADFMRDLNLILGVLGKRQSDLFPEEALKAAKREEDRKKKAQEEKTAAGRLPDHPRSDPAKGGAGKTAEPAAPSKVVQLKPGEATKAGAAASDAALQASIKAVSEREAADGEEVLSQAPTSSQLPDELPPDPPSSETKLSQSAQAAQRLEAAKLN